MEPFFSMGRTTRSLILGFPWLRSGEAPMERMNWDDICRAREYAGRWVALDGCTYDEGSGRATEGAVVDSDDDLVELCNRIRES